MSRQLIISTQTANPLPGSRKLTIVAQTATAINGDKRLRFPNHGNFFALSQPATTSAGVFDANGRLIRTLWNNVAKEAGQVYVDWNGKDDDGNPVTINGHQFKVITNNVTYAWQNVIGNNSDSMTGSGVWHLWDYMRDMVQVGNYIYCAGGYTEGYKRPAQIKFHINAPRTKLDIAGVKDLLGIGQQTKFVCSDGTRIYFGGEDPYSVNGLYSFVFAVNASNNAMTAFSSGVVYNGNTIYNSVIAVQDNTNIAAPANISGMAVQQSGNYLFISRDSMNQIVVVNKTTGAAVTVISTFTAPRNIKLQGDNSLWIVSDINTIARYPVNSDGTLGSASLTITGINKPVGLGITQDNSMIAVMDADSHQIKAFNTNDGSAAWTLGQSGGYESSPAIANDRFLFRAIKRGLGFKNYGFIAFLTDGSFWVSDLGTNRYQHFDSSRNYINNILFHPNNKCAGVDPNNPNHVFADFMEYAIDYTNNTWMPVNNWAGKMTTDYYLDYYRLRNPVTLTYNGIAHVYAIVWNTALSKMEIAELVPGVGLRYTGVRMATFFEKIYADGSIGQTTKWVNGQPALFQRKPLLSIDGNGNPLWGAYVTLAQTPPGITDDPVSRNALGWSYKGCEITSTGIAVSFDEHKPGSTDTTFKQGSSKWHLGAVKVGESQWLWKTAKRTGLNYTGDYPTDGSFDDGNNTNNPGGYLNVLERSIFWNHHGEFWKAGQTNMFQHVWDNGLMIGQFGAVTTIGSRDAKDAPAKMAGNNLTGGILKVGNDYHLFHVDESWHGGMHWWKISGLDTILEFQLTAKITI